MSDECSIVTPRRPAVPIATHAYPGGPPRPVGTTPGRESQQ